MSPVATAWRLAAVAALAAVALSAQIPRSVAAPFPSVSWRRVGLPSINLHLAGAATGPVDSVWYSGDGGTLFARTPSGRVFETADGENWSRTDATRPDNAQSVNRTSLEGAEPAIGAGQRDIASNPAEPSALAVGNDFGIWQTHDGGTSWAGLNDNLPNLPVSRIVSTRRGALKIALEDGRVLQLEDSREPWMLAAPDDLQKSEGAEHRRMSRTLAAEITASAHGGELAYAGSSDGRVWVSRDRGVTWGQPQSVGSGPIQRFYVDADMPRAALAIVPVIDEPGTRLFRTVNAGAVWDDVTGNLTGVAVMGVTADRSSGTAYAATERGVYVARVDLNAFAPPSPWTAINGSLPAARAVDVALDAAGAQLFVAVDGYGLYTAPAPIRNGALRISNSADFSSRAAAPGSLISVTGGRITSARAGSLIVPVLAASENESQLQIPFEAQPQTLELSLQLGALNSTVPLAVHSVSPAIFIDHDGSPLLVNAESGLTIDAASSAHPGARLQFLATGLGRVQPDWPTGVPAPAENPPAVAASVQAFLDGVPLEVSRATLAPGYVGYYLVEIQLPTILNAGPAELYLAADGQQSNKVRLQLDSQ